MVTVTVGLEGVGDPVTGAPLCGDFSVWRNERADNRTMSSQVCCPGCWTWSDLGKRTTCLILPDGRTVETANTDPPPPPPPPPGFGYPARPSIGMPAPFAGPVSQSLTKAPGTDWVAVCRWITIGYGLLVVLGLIFVGLLVRHIDVPLTDPSTGITTVQTFDIGAAFAIGAVIAGALFALFAWLTRYTVARVIFLLLDGLAVLSALSGLGRTQGFGVLGLVSLAFDVGYGGALVMSLLPRPQPAYG
jgi:hypothetical protein